MTCKLVVPECPAVKVIDRVVLAEVMLPLVMNQA
jgi:hypothetical protein